APAANDDRCATVGERAAITRPMTSVATSDPQTGIAHASSVSSHGPAAAGVRLIASLTRNIATASGTPPTRMTTATSIATRPTVRIPPCSTSVTASASNPPNIVYAIVNAAAAP